MKALKEKKKKDTLLIKKIVRFTKKGKKTRSRSRKKSKIQEEEIENTPTTNK